MGGWWGFHKELWTHSDLSSIKSINQATRFGISKLRYKIEKATLAKFENIEKYLLDDMSYNYTIIIDNGDNHDNYVCHLLRDTLSMPNWTFNDFIEETNDDWDTGSYVLA